VASGTPTTEGPAVFTVTAGNTSCTFTVPVTGSQNPPPVGNTDLFPLAVNNWWSYSFNNEPDTFLITDVGQFNIDGKQYHRHRVSDDEEGPYDSGYYRKSGDDYFTYFEADGTAIPGLEGTVKGDILVMKDNPAVGDTWQTTADIRISGADATLRFSVACTAANVTETVGGRTFNAVYKITLKREVGSAGVWQSFGAEEEVWFARGVGVIYQKWTEGTDSYDHTIRHWNVQ
jgi:hypothetical protein